jgi:putative transposase
VHAKYPIETIAICVLPDHLHAIWRLPEGDGAFGLRWSLIKRSFSTGLPASEQRSDSKRAKREKGLWQRRFWEHEIRDDLDLQRHVDNVHYNPVKHGLVRQAKDWPHSSFHRHVEMGLLAVNWGGGDIGIASQYGE